MAESDTQKDNKKDAKDATEDKEEAQSQEVEYTGKTVIRLGKNVEIFITKPAKWGGNPFVEAYEARQRSDGRGLIAIFCDRGYTPRTNQLSQYKTVINPNLMKLVASGPVRSPKDKKEYFTLVYEDNIGVPLVEDDSNVALGLKSELVQNDIIVPLVYALNDLHNKDIIHGAVRPSNIFRGSMKEISTVVLGDCMSAPVGLNQAAIFEPPERALAQPSGRGEGVPQDDLYALGVTIVMLLRTGNSLKNVTEEEIIQRKLENGSFATLAGAERLTGPLLELLRGLLVDDPRDRWDIEDVIAWIEGRRLKPKTASRGSKAARQISFNNKKFFYSESLAMEIANKPNMIDEIIETGELVQWLQRSVTDKKKVAKVEEAMRTLKKTATSKSSLYQERLATRIAIALHPEGPIRYRGLSILPAGLGHTLIEAFHLKKDLSFFHEMLLHDEFLFWLSCNEDSVWDVNSMYPVFETCRGFAQTSAAGYGLERCAYFLNGEAPCLSPILKNYFIRSPEDLMRAMEVLCKTKKKPDNLFDRHVISFLLAKERNLLENSLIDINSKDYWRQIVGKLKVLSTIQKRENMEDFPAISKWFADHMRPVYNRFHDREFRVDLQEKIAKAKSKGDLVKIYNLVDDAEAIQKDAREFRRAMKDYRNLEKERIKIEMDLDDAQSIGVKKGNEIAAIVCFFICLILVLGSAAATFGSYQYLGF